MNKLARGAEVIGLAFALVMAACHRSVPPHILGRRTTPPNELRPITIDGDLSDWESVKGFTMDQEKFFFVGQGMSSKTWGARRIFPPPSRLCGTNNTSMLPCTWLMTKSTSRSARWSAARIRVHGTMTALSSCSTTTDRTCRTTTSAIRCITSFTSCTARSIRSSSTISGNTRRARRNRCSRCPAERKSRWLFPTR